MITDLSLRLDDLQTKSNEEFMTLARICKVLEFAYFRPNNRNFSWFLYPIPKTREPHERAKQHRIEVGECL